jgi:hypothetical protein
MLFRCQRQAARRGEVCFFKLDHDMTDGAGHDAFLGAPEGLSGLAGSDAEPRLPSACHLLQGGGGDMPGIPGQACLADPQTGALASGLHCCERKACDRCPVAVSRFRNLMHAIDYPARKGKAAGCAGAAVTGRMSPLDLRVARSICSYFVLFFRMSQFSSRGTEPPAHKRKVPAQGPALA